mmetsp:Transcript_67097/g.132288  ORF Transcript_67097/g.132288 Transcript_67097/m.132288 type:complete len:248 (+) Transcript_67097:478-1221(+)
MTPSAASTLILISCTRWSRLRVVESFWNLATRARPASICCCAFVSSARAVSLADSASRPTSTSFRLTNFRASVNSTCASAADISIACNKSVRSSDVMVSSPMRKGVSVSRILFKTSSMPDTLSIACFRIGTAAARDCASSMVFCAVSSIACAVSARAVRSRSLFRIAPFKPEALLEMSRIVGANVADATRRASLVSRMSLPPMASGFMSSDLASGSAITAAFSQSISTPARRVAKSPKSFSAAKANS